MSCFIGSLYSLSIQEDKRVPVQQCVLGKSMRDLSQSFVHSSSYLVSGNVEKIVFSQFS